LAKVTKTPATGGSSQRIKRIVILLTFGLVILGFGYRIEDLSYRTYVQDLEMEATIELIEVREKIQTEIFDQILKLRELATIISENPRINQQEFGARAQDFLDKNPDVINVAAAPDQVVTIVHPLKGNESVIGLDYRTNAEQYPKVLQAMETGEGLVTGPVNLVQGGQGLILRQPVFYAMSDGDTAPRRAWGILSMVVDYQRFVEKLKINEIEERYDVVIREVNSDGLVEQIILGDPDVALHDPITLGFNFSIGQWEMAATTNGGWPAQRPNHARRWLIRIVGISAAMALLSYIMRLAETRRIAESRLYNGIEALDHGFVMFDPDGNLVVHNDKYKEMHSARDVVAPGVTYESIVRDSIQRGLVPDAIGNEKEWVRIWLEKQEQGAFDTEQRMLDGRIIKTSDRRMKDGSIVGLRIDVTDLKKAQLAAENANKAKTDFMGVLSHELRTPLTVILGHVRLARHFDKQPVARALSDAINELPGGPENLQPRLEATFDKMSQIMSTVERSGNHLLMLINEVLDFAKIDAGGLSIEKEPVDIDDIVEPAVDQMRPLVEDKGLQFDVTCQPGILIADAKRVQQILINLISNAAKFSDAGEVRLVVTNTGDTMEFRVSDSGIGIPEAELERVFEPFHQVDSSAARRFGGTGLGLAISRDIALAHGGSLTATSVEGEGSTFLLTLPLQEQASIETGLSN
tara:strand:- start:67514 stop:69589 length:2076 start_codon:yes stop_codon:yes gene_type:complete